jgi:hypothetical protein
MVDHAPPLQCTFRQAETARSFASPSGTSPPSEAGQNAFKPPNRGLLPHGSPAKSGRSGPSPPSSLTRTNSR